MDTSATTDLILRGADDLGTRSRQLHVDAASGALMLARDDRLRLAQTDAAAADALLAGQRPMLCDVNRSVGWISDDGTTLVTGPLSAGRPNAALAVPVQANDPDAIAASAELLELSPVQAPVGSTFTALAMRERRIALGWSGPAGSGLSVVELGVKRHYRLALDAMPLRLEIDPGQRIWVLTDDNRLLRCEGGPLPQPWLPAADVFRPLRDNPHPLAVHQPIPLGGERPAADAVRALCSDADALYLLTAEAVFALVLEPPFGRWQRYALDESLTAAFTDARVIGGARLALWVPVALDDSEPMLDCPIIELDGDAERAWLVRERWPRRSPRHNAFVAGPEAAPTYLSALAQGRPEGGVLALTALPQARYRTAAAAILSGTADSRRSGTLWDRIRFTACIPEGSSLRLHARAYDAGERLAGLDWHDQGEPVPVSAATDWELPLAGQGGAGGPRVFELVLRRERDTGAVRELRGRWLQLKVQMTGNGLVTPSLYALAVRHPRRSWQRLHLPEFMHQGEAPVEDARGLANGADVRERMLAALAGVLEPLAARIDGAEMLVDPLTAPVPLLPALAAMRGESPPAHWPEHRRRTWLAMSGDLQRWRGTFNGLALALDIATDHAVRRGQVVPLEDWRLRRPLLTALGIDFAAERHPLTLGTVQSGNSIVGDTLTLGPDDVRTLLLELLPDADPHMPIPALLERFADRHAYRLSVVVHSSAGSLRGLIDEVLAAELPAHVDAKVIETEAPFVPGLAPLLGIHTFLEGLPGWRRMVLDRERIGSAAVLVNEPLLAPGRNLSPAFYGDQ